MLHLALCTIRSVDFFVPKVLENTSIFIFDCAAINLIFVIKIQNTEVS